MANLFFKYLALLNRQKMLMSILLADTPVKGGGVTNFFSSGDISLLGVKNIGSKFAVAKFLVISTSNLFDGYEAA